MACVKRALGFCEGDSFFLTFVGDVLHFFQSIAIRSSFITQALPHIAVGPPSSRTTPSRMLRILRTIIENTYPYDSEEHLISAMQHMVRIGHIEPGWDGAAAGIWSMKCLQYLISIGYEHKSHNPAAHFAERGDLKMLRFVHEHGWPILHEQCFWDAISNEHYDCATYLHGNGSCCYTFGRSNEDQEYEYKENLRIVVRNVLLPKWRALTRMRGIAIYWHNQSGITSHAENGVGRKRDLNAFLSEFTSS